MKILPVKNRINNGFSKIKTNKQVSRGLLYASLAALSVLGLSTAKSCSKIIQPDKEKNSKQIDSTLINDTTNNINIVVDDSYTVTEHIIVL